MNTVQYLEAVKRRLRIESDYALAKRLDLTTQAVSKLRHHRLAMSNTTAARVAELLDVDPLKVIADMELERGTDAELWKRIARKVAGVMIAAIGAGVLLAPSPADASLQRSATPVYYVKWRELLRLAGFPIPDDRFV